MSKLFSSIFFSFLLLFQTTAIADEEIIPSEAEQEVQEVQKSEATEENHTQEEVEPVEVLSEAEKEALAAEEAELRELGMEKEPVPE